MISEMLREFVLHAGELSARFRSPPEACTDRARFVTGCFRTLERLRDLTWDIREDLKNPERLRELPGREGAGKKIQSFLEDFEEVFKGQLFALKHVPNAAAGAERDDVWWKTFTFHRYVFPPAALPSRTEEEIAAAMESDLAPLERFEAELRSLRDWIDGLPPSAPKGALSPAAVSCIFRREGEIWHLAFAGQEVLLKDCKGLEYIEALLREPHKEMNVLELTGVPDEHGIPTGDPEAVKTLKRKISDLKFQRDEAKEQNSVSAAPLDERIEELEKEYTRMTGLRERIREVTGSTERTRKAVGKCVQEALEKVQEYHGPLGRHLDGAIRTGATCSYRPEVPIPWEF